MQLLKWNPSFSSFWHDKVQALGYFLVKCNNRLKILSQKGLKSWSFTLCACFFATIKCLLELSSISMKITIWHKFIKHIFERMVERICRQIFGSSEWPRKGSPEAVSFDKGASINYVDKQGGGRGQRYYISLFNKLVKDGGGGLKILKILST